MRLRRLASFVAIGALAATALVGCSDEQGSTEEFCARLSETPSLEAVLARFNEIDRGVLQARIDQTRAAYDALAEAAPASIEAETEQVVELVDEVLTAVEENPLDPTKAADQLRKVMADHPDIDEARTEVAAFAEEECDVKLDPSLAESTTTTAAAKATTTTTTEPGG